MPAAYLHTLHTSKTVAFIPPRIRPILTAKAKAAINMDDDRLVPGTTHLVDLEGVLNAKHASGFQKDVVLVPSPSADPDDPLNWSAKRKMLSTASVCVCVALPRAQMMRPRLNGLYQLHIVHRHSCVRNILGFRAYSQRHGPDSGRSECWDRVHG